VFENENPLDAGGEVRLYGSMRRFWHPVAYSSDLKSGPLKAVLLGEEIVLARLGGSVRAFRDLCVHRGTPLSLGWALLGLRAHSAFPPQADEWLEAAATKVQSRDRSPHKLALLALAAKGWPA